MAGHSRSPPCEIVLIEHPIQYRIVPLPAPEHLLARHSLAPVAGFLQGPLAADVVRARFRLQPVEPQRFKRELCAHLHRAAAEPLPPGGFLADYRPRAAQPQLPVDAVNPREPDVPVLVVRDRPYQLPGPITDTVAPVLLPP